MPTRNNLAVPPFDPELAQRLGTRQVEAPPRADYEEVIRSRASPRSPSIDELLATRGLVREDQTVPGLDGAPAIALSVFTRREHRRRALGIYFIHGGGMIGGDRFTTIERALDWVEGFDGVAMSVEYRLAPEHPDPAPVSDCYAGLLWTAAHAQDLGFDEDRLIIAGGSAGGGLAAGATLMARDRGGPALAAQILMAPMLDDRNETISSYQIDGIGVWDRTSNQAGWDALLGDRRGTDEVSAYAAPARASDLSGLPATYIDCGSAEVFRDEDLAYAAAIWSAGGIAELHVWAGACHGFDVIFPAAALSAAARRARSEFIRRTLQLSGETGDS
jgi:acetyl esterase/lipase